MGITLNTRPHSGVSDESTNVGDLTVWDGEPVGRTKRQ